MVGEHFHGRNMWVEREICHFYFLFSLEALDT